MKKKISKEEYSEYRKVWDKAGTGDHVTKYPTHVDLELSSACDSRCAFCPVTPNYADMPEVKTLTKGAIFPIGYMLPDLFIKIINEIQGKVKSLKLNWRGESTLHPAFNTLVSHAMNKDFIEVMINTHGNYPARKQDAVHSLDKVIFSIDSLQKEKYESIRRKLSFDRLMKNYEDAYDHFEKHGSPKIKINMTVTSRNEDEVDTFKSYFPNDVEVRFAPVYERTSTGNTYRLANLTKLGRKNCKYPMQRIMIGWNGKTRPCCVDWKEQTDIITGDASKQTIKEIWESRKTKLMQITAKTQTYDKFKACKNCDSWASYQVVDSEKLASIY